MVKAGILQEALTLNFSFDLAIHRDGTFQVVGAKPRIAPKTMFIGLWLVRCSIGCFSKSDSRTTYRLPSLIEQQILLLEPQDLQIQARQRAPIAHFLKNY
jgi:hypothetical protein